MIDPQAKVTAYLRLMGLVTLLGIATAVVTFAFIALVNAGSRLIWGQIQTTIGMDARLFTLLVCILGGLLVGLLVKLFGDHTAILAEVMQEFGKTGRFDYRNAPGIVVTSFISLIFGASLGPEAAMADGCGGLGTWITDRLGLGDKEMRTMGYSGVSGMLAAFITAPLGGAVLALESAQGGPSADKKEYFWVLFPSLLASASSTVVFVLLSGGVFFQTLFKFPEYVPRLVDLAYAVPLGLLGGLIGTLFMLTLKHLKRLFQPMKGHVVLRGMLGGIGMGLIGALLPLTLYSGQEQMIELMRRATEIGVVMLIVLALAKLFATSLLLAAGWKGGYVFPLMFAAIALGMAGDLLFPNIPVAVTVSATMAGVLVASLQAPLFAALFTLALVQKETAAVIAVAVVVSAQMNALLSLLQARRAGTQPQAIPAEAEGEPRRRNAE